MKFKAFIDIHKPRDVVSRFFVDPQYLKDYQEGCEKKELLKGEEGKVGSISKMYYKQGNKEMVLTETIKANNLPNSFEAFYHHKQMDNTLLVTFTAIDMDKTRYTMEVDYVRMVLFPKIMGFIFPNMFRKQGEKWMQNFKELVERS